MQPLKFEPILKQTLWGGDKIIPFKRINSDLSCVGENWEISGVKGSESIVSEGPHQGKSIHQVIDELKGELMGEDNYKRFGSEFPLLIKFIDARQDLSIQVHPNDEIAQLQGKKRGKTEMWYVMKSDPDAKLRSGLKEEITPEEYKKMVENDTITDVIAEFPVQEGDCFFIPSGRIHSIGPVVFWRRYNRHQMSPTVSMTSSARIRMEKPESCIPIRPLSPSTIMLTATIRRHTYRL